MKLTKATCHHLVGYLNDTEATASTIDVDGWLHTGDIGYVDDDDEIFIVDRVKELIKFKGFQASFKYFFLFFRLFFSHQNSMGAFNNEIRADLCSKFAGGRGKFRCLTVL